MTPLSLIQFFFLNLATLISSVILCSLVNNFKAQKISKIIIQTFTVYFSQIILIEIILGIFGKISHLNVSIFTYTIFTTLLIFFGKKTFQKFQIEKFETPPWIILTLVFTPLLILGFIKFLSAISSPPMEYDSLAYHLPFIVEWLKTGSLLTPYYSAFAGPISYYPDNYELLGLWSMLPFNNDFFADLLNFPILVLLGIVLYSVQRNFNISKKISLLTIAVIFYMPVFFHQLGTALTDLFFALNFATIIYFLQQFYYVEKSEKNSAAIFFGLSLGIFIGTKYLGLVYAIIPIIFFLALCGKKFGALILGLASCIITGSFFYIRNFVDVGNPIFPAELKIFGLKIFEGYLGLTEKISSLSLNSNITNLQGLKEFIVKFYQNIGIQITVILAGIIFLLIFIIYKKITKKLSLKSFLTGMFFIIIPIIYFYLYWIAPYTYVNLAENIRYATPFLITGAITMGLALIQNDFAKKIFVAATVLTIVHTLVFRGEFRLENFSINYENQPQLKNILSAAEWIEQNTPSDSKIAYAGFNLHYPLYGRTLKREVDYVNINECLECRYGDFKNHPLSIRRNPSYENWLKNLTSKDKDYLVLYPFFVEKNANYELIWATSHKEKFTEVFNKGFAYVYKINKNP